jgi:hypothetical protein
MSRNVVMRKAILAIGVPNERPDGAHPHRKSRDAAWLLPCRGDRLPNSEKPLMFNCKRLL